MVIYFSASPRDLKSINIIIYIWYLHISQPHPTVSRKGELVCSLPQHTVFNLECISILLNIVLLWKETFTKQLTLM